MKNNYDLIFIGMGPSSIFCAYELIKNNCKLNILMIEKGKRIEDRKCPASNYNKCLKCKPICNIIGGFSGAGAFSDGKLLSYHLSTYNKKCDDNSMYIGGKADSYIKKYYSNEEIKKYMEYVDNMYLELGACNSIEGLENKEEIQNLQKLSKENNISLIDVPIRHLGTEKSHELYKKIQDFLINKIDLLFNTEVTDIIVEKNEIKGIKINEKSIYSDKVIFAVGVDGSIWLESLCKKYNIKTRNGYMDIGIRYELNNSTMDKINKLLYEGKFIGKLSPYYDKVRTYCQNPSGYVTPETYDNGCTLVNGHAYKDKKSNNTNLAILVSYKFEEPFNSPNEYGFNIARKANLISGGKPIVQRYGDLVNHECTTKEKLRNNKVVPTTLSAYPGDLSYVLDYRTIVNIKNFIESINKIIPGFNGNDNLMYGPEIKFYGNELVLNKEFETSLKSLYSIGTGGGLTIGLMMASVSGVMLAHKLGGIKI